MASDAAPATEAAARPSEKGPFLVLWALLLASLVVLALVPEHVAANTTAALSVALLILLGVIDLVTMRVPNLLVYPAILFALAATAVIDYTLLTQALAGGGALLAIMFLLAIIGRGAMGMGDVKAACFSGCVLGLKAGIASLLLGFAAGAIIALPLMILMHRSRKDFLPLTPFLAAGSIFIGLIVGFLVQS